MSNKVYTRDQLNAIIRNRVANINKELELTQINNLELQQSNTRLYKLLEGMIENDKRESSASRRKVRAAGTRRGTSRPRRAAGRNGRIGRSNRASHRGLFG